jgi:transposase-like protein
VREPCGWYWTTKPIILRNGRRSGGCTPETLRSWVRQAEQDQGLRPGPTSEERERIKALASMVLTRAVSRALTGCQPG